MKTDHAVSWTIVLALVLVVLILISLCVGATPIAFGDLWRWLLGQGEGSSHLILTHFRLPRVLLAALVGAVLGLCGAVSQGLFRNPLADPSLIGVTAGASAGAGLVIVLFESSALSFWGLSAISVGAFSGAVLVVVCVYHLARRGGSTSVATMLLAGIAFSYLAGSVTGILDYMADDPRLRQLSLWRMGGLEGANWLNVVVMAAVGAVLMVLLLPQAKALNALLLGESEARYLGIRVDQLKRIIVVAMALGVGVSVALAGAIAFVGLVVPHMVRTLVGSDHRKLLPLSALAGAILIVLADDLARVLVAPAELPVGLLTAILGAPVFIVLLRRQYGGA